MEINIFHINCETVHLFQFLRKKKKIPIISVSAITALLYSMKIPSLLKPKKDTGPNRRPQEGKETQLLTILSHSNLFLAREP